MATSLLDLPVDSRKSERQNGVGRERRFETCSESPVPLNQNALAIGQGVFYCWGKCLTLVVGFFHYL
jgi:hypothetical protein